jgi:XTP/dITP diphosphohydrolase|tara:strand:+ start:390 stop:1007 length:618 start_codon:yes stop_codon:yes gene_type:complete
LKNFPEKIVLATGNVGKLKEINELFAAIPTDIAAQGEFGIESPEETGQTFMENALLKARYAVQQTGLPAIADDSGLSVDALDGRPGVHSARYAGEDATDAQNIDLLLKELDSVAEDLRGAGFHCAVALVFPDDKHAPLIAQGVWRGQILRQREGIGGFGYDPVFYDKAEHKTGAQMSRTEKNAVSHRGRAFSALLPQVEALLEKN